MLRTWSPNCASGRQWGTRTHAMEFDVEVVLWLKVFRNCETSRPFDWSPGTSRVLGSKIEIDREGTCGSVLPHSDLSSF